jgi:hypothetical protein
MFSKKKVLFELDPGNGISEDTLIPLRIIVLTKFRAMVLSTRKLVNQTSICDLSARVEAIGQSVFCSIAASDISPWMMILNLWFIRNLPGVSVALMAVKLLQRP